MSVERKLGSSSRDGKRNVASDGERRILPFPCRGNARLISFAQELRIRFARCSPAHDPFLFLLSTRPITRLAIDRAASIEFRGDRSEYRVAIEASADTKVTVETGDFDTVADFVGQYIAARLSQPNKGEVAS
jgi:hypothetical protein